MFGFDSTSGREFRRTRTLFLAVAAVVALLLLGAAPPVHAAGGGRLASYVKARVDIPGAGRSAASQRAELLGYWTPARMREVVRATEGAAAPSATGPVNDTVGKIFFKRANGKADECTGSAVDTPKSTLVMTVGHCLNSGGAGAGWSTDVVFVPGYDNGASPYGVFPAWNIAVDALWDSQADVEHDYGMIITEDNSLGEHVADAAGAFPVVANLPKVQDVTIIGYPGQAPYNGRVQEYCTDITEPQPAPSNLIQAYCPTMAPGASGGPWLVDYDESDQLGSIDGLLSVGYGNGYVASPLFDTRTLQFVSLMDTLAGARP